MKQPFSSQLQTLRTNAQLTNKELAHIAKVPESLISGLQNEHRRIGEYQARKIGRALHLWGDTLEQFVLDAIDNCTEKVLKDSQSYPADLLNLLVTQLKHAGIHAQAIRDYTIAGDPYERDIKITLHGGKEATLRTQLVCG